MRRLAFRAWFYFRQGWSTYFAFIVAALNTMVTTYYLAIKDVPALKAVFPSFASYIVILTVIGVPILVAAGYVHYKRSQAFKAEADINMEANPHFRRMLINTEMFFPMYLKLTEILIKLSKNEKLTEKEVSDLSTYQKELEEYMKRRTIKESQ